MLADSLSMVRHRVARNVRKLMNERDITILRLAQILEADPATLGKKVNGYIIFSEGELGLLAGYFNTTVLDLCGGKMRWQEHAIIQNSWPERKRREQSQLIRLIRLTDKDEQLRKVMEKLFVANLAGKIGSLILQVREKVLKLALEKYEPALNADLTEDERADYIDHYCHEYEGWKATLGDFSL